VAFARSGITDRTEYANARTTAGLHNVSP
jgi:hypothetical protein